MESTGRPGQIHITEETYNFLEDKYITEDGEDVEGNDRMPQYVLFLV